MKLAESLKDFFAELVQFRGTDKRCYAGGILVFKMCRLDAQVGHRGKGGFGMDHGFNFVSAREKLIRDDSKRAEVPTCTHNLIRRLNNGESSVKVSYSPPSPQM